MHIHYLSVVIAAIVQWLLGIFWYGVVFKKSWRKLIGLAEGEKPKHGIFTLASGLLSCLLLSFIMAHFFTLTGVRLSSEGFSVGVTIWLGFMAPPLYAQHVLEGRRANLFVINAAYWLMAMGLGSAVLAVIH
jgi:uncharacterized protein YacL